MEKKKPTTRQMQNRLKNAILHIDRTKDTKQIYFDDRGLNIVVNEDWACIGSGNYTCTFNVMSPSGISIQYTFLKRFLDVALKNEDTFLIVDKNGKPMRSYSLFLKTLKKEYEQGNDKENDYLWAWYVDKWIYNYECNLASLGESPWQSFSTYEKFIHNIACNHIILEEKTENMTNHQYFAKVIEKMQEYMKGVQENVIFEAKSDEEKQKEQLDALQEIQQEQILKEQENGSEQQ